MLMNKHLIVKTTLGVGLMATSLAASAVLHTFAEPMMYYRADGAKVTYVAFVPSMAGTGNLYLELGASGTQSTWAYGLSTGALGAGNGGSVWSLSGGSVEFSGFAGGATITGTDSTQTWYGGNTGTLTASFFMQPTISSQACNVTFNAHINTDDYLMYGATSSGSSAPSVTLQPAGWPVMNAVNSQLYYRTASGTSSTDTASYGSAAWNGSNFSTTRAFSTFSNYTLASANLNSSGGGSVAVYAPSSLTRANLCAGWWVERDKMNGGSAVLGGKSGMMRLW